MRSVKRSPSKERLGQAKRREEQSHHHAPASAATVSLEEAEARVEAVWHGSQPVPVSWSGPGRQDCDDQPDGQPNGRLGDAVERPEEDAPE